jgi:hypothetical protein
MSIGKITNASVARPHAVSLSWDDGWSAIVDLSAIIAARKALSTLSDPASFAQVTLTDDGWSIEWPSAIDFGAQQLRRWAEEQAGNSMPAEAFRHWMEGHHLTLDRAAEALGLSRRTIAYYLSGEQPVSKTVLLATEGYDRRMAA